MSNTPEPTTRIQFTGPEVVHLVGLCWNVLKSYDSSSGVDWTTASIFNKALRAARAMDLDLKQEEVKPK